MPSGLSSKITLDGSVRPCFTASSLPIIIVHAFPLEIHVCWILVRRLFSLLIQEIIDL